MSPHADVIIERIDDVPLLLAQLGKMRVQELLDLHFPTHGNWLGLSLGRVVVVWLAYILSQGDHRLNQLQPWSQTRLQTLRCCLNQFVAPLDFSDDRLAAILDALADDYRWDAFEAALTRGLLRVYDLHSECVRLDTTTVSSDAIVSPAGLFQFGQSKDHRPDLPQVKVALATLDPLGLPLVTRVVAGNCADDPLYLPAIQAVRSTLQRRELLYVGDSKMATLQTRAVVEQDGDYYLCPLAGHHLSAEELDAYLAPVVRGQQALTVLIPGTEDPAVPEVEGFELSQEVNAEVDGKPVTWTERRLLLHSPTQAAAEEAALQGRVAAATAALRALNERGHGKRRRREAEPVWAQVSAILRRYQVLGLIRVTCREEVNERSVRAYRERPAGVVVEREFWVSATIEEEALTRAVSRLGWRVHASNAPPERLTTVEMVASYRGQYRIERGFGRLKGRPLSVSPLYLQREKRVTGLIRLLSIALSGLCVAEHGVRERLRASGERLKGLYVGQPQRETAEPTSERLFGAFGEVNLVLLPGIPERRRHVTPLSALQERILALLELPTDTYSRLARESLDPVPK